MSKDSVLRSATDAQLGVAVEENVFAMFRAMTSVLNGEVEERPYLSRYHASPNSPIFKGVYRTNLPSEETDEAIRATIEWFKERGAPCFFWWTGNDSRPDDLGQRLDAPAMVANNDQLDWDNPRPANLRLNPIANEAELMQ